MSRERQPKYYLSFLCFLFIFYTSSQSQIKHACSSFTIEWSYDLTTVDRPLSYCSYLAISSILAAQFCRPLSSLPPSITVMERKQWLNYYFNKQTIFPNEFAEFLERRTTYFTYVKELRWIYPFTETIPCIHLLNVSYYKTFQATSELFQQETK